MIIVTNNNKDNNYTIKYLSSDTSSFFMFKYNHIRLLGPYENDAKVLLLTFPVLDLAPLPD